MAKSRSSDTRTEKYSPTDQDITKYLEEQRKLLKQEPKADLTFNQFLKNQYFPNQDVTVVANFVNRTFSQMDLSGGDFSGCIFKKTKFMKCNLANAAFCDVDFDEAYFEDSVLKNIDFRGADLANCQFSDKYKDYSSLGRSDEITGIKFSTTASLGRKYANIKGELEKRKERQDLIAAKEQELNEAYKGLTWKETGWLTAGRATGNEKYDRLAKELQDMRAGKFVEKERNMHMHKTFQNVFSSSSDVFDPAYIRGSSKAERDQEVQYVSLTRKDVEEYLIAIKKNQDLSLNDFAKLKIGSSKLKDGARVVADCSGLTLSGLVFEKADLSGSIFTGADLSNCEFIKSKIARASFEGAGLSGSLFEEVDGNGVNAFGADLTLARIINSDFSYSMMSRSIGDSLTVEGSKFNYANIKAGQWNNASILGSEFNHANAESINLALSIIANSQMQAMILNRAVLKELMVSNTDMSYCSMHEANAQKAKFKKNTILKEIQARAIDLSDSELDSTTNADRANLQLSKLKGIQAKGVSFADANLSMIEAQDAILTGATLEGADARFTNFSGANLEGVKAASIDLSNGNLKNVKANRADFSFGVMRRVNGEGAEFEETVFTGTELTDARLPQSTLDRLPDAGAKLEGVGPAEPLTLAKRTSIVTDVFRVLPTLSNVREIKALLDSYSVWAQTNNELWFGGLRVEDKPPVVRKNVDGMLGIIQNAGTVLNQQASRLQKAESDLLKATVAQYSIIPTLNFLLTPVPYVGPNQAAPGTFDMFNGIVSDKFISNLGALTLDLLPGIGAANETVRALYQNIMLPDSNIKMTDQIMDVLDTPEIAQALTDSFVKFLKDDENREAITKMAAYVIEGRYPAFRSNDLFADTVSLVADSVIPVLAHVPAVVDIYRTYQSYQSLEAELLSGKELSEDRRKEIAAAQDKNISSILAEANKVLTDLFPVLGENLPGYLTKNKENILKVLDTELAQRTLKSYGMDPKVTKEIADIAIPFVADALPAIASHIPTNIPAAVDIYRTYQSYQSLSAELLSDKVTEDRRKAIAVAQNKSILSILAEANKVLTDLSPVLGKNLPEYLTKNKENVLKVLDSELAQRTLKSYGINSEFVKEVAGAAIPFVADTLPILVNFTKDCLKDQQSRDDLLKIMDNARMVMNTPQSEQSAKLKVFVESLVQFYDSHPGVKSVLQEQIPDLLIKHAPTFGPLIDKFTNETEIGRKLKLQGKDVIEALVPHSKDFQAIADVYISKKGYGAMVRPIFNLLSDRKVLSLIASSGLNWFNHSWQKNWVSNTTRRKVVEKEAQTIIGSLNGSAGADKDLSSIFHGALEERRKVGPVNAIIDYSLSNKDLQGLSFEQTNMKLDGYKIQGFSMDNVTFGECSLKGTTIENCSFKGAVFTKKVYFDGATIDGNTLKTLIPAIRRYNQSLKGSPVYPISLNKIKVVGEVDFDVLTKLKSTDHNLSLEQANVKLDGYKMKGSSLNYVTFGECSLKGTTLENCSFMDVVFTKGVNFDGATIDSNTLKTLIPAIEEYNKKHVKDPISLDKIKIAGTLDPILQNNPLLLQATLPKLKATQVTKEGETPDKKHRVWIAQSKDAISM